jgi:hypothetical protein
MRRNNNQKTQLNQYKTYFFLFYIGVIFLLAGCESIPPGNPPEGAIVSIATTSNHPLPPKDAINNMITAIGTCPLLYSEQDIPSISLYPITISDSEKEYESQLNPLTVRLYRNLIEMDMITVSTGFNAKNIDFFLASTFSKIFTDTNEEENNQPLLFKWEVKLLSPEKTSISLWKQSIEVKLDRNNTKSK